MARCFLALCLLAQINLLATLNGKVYLKFGLTLLSGIFMLLKMMIQNVKIVNYGGFVKEVVEVIPISSRAA